jgi:hypothetical protein
VELADSIDERTTGPMPPLGFISKFKRSILWHISGKNSGNYSSYDEYKHYWRSSSTWSKFKSDFKASHFSTNNNVDKGAENLMNDIRNTRIQGDIDRQNFRNEYNRGGK